MSKFCEMFFVAKTRSITELSPESRQNLIFLILSVSPYPAYFGPRASIDYLANFISSGVCCCLCCKSAVIKLIFSFFMLCSQE